MSTPKFAKKIMNVNDAIVDLKLNVRLEDQYDIPQMVDSIVSAGRILMPISVEKLTDDSGKVTYKVLRGNRRSLAAQSIMSDPNQPAELKAALAKTEFMVYEGLSEAERMALVVDHDSKGLSRTELVLTIWRLAKAMFSEREIAAMLYFLLAKYTGNERKLNELPSNGAERAKKLTSWFHGTLGNYILAVQRMPEYVREAFILTHKIQDGIIKSENANLPVKLNQSRVSTLSKAKTKDTNDKVWDDVNGGPAFTEAWTKMVQEDAGILTKEKVVRPSSEDIERSISIYQSEIVKKALKASLGDKQMDLGDLDSRTYREAEVFKILWEVSGNGKIKPEYADLIKAMLSGDTNTVAGLITK
jgi:hypothetical protein